MHTQSLGKECEVCVRYHGSDSQLVFSIKMQTDEKSASHLEMLHLHVWEDPIQVPLIRLLLQWADVS